MIEVVDLRKSFGAHRVLEGVSFRIEKGESVVIIGRSGCGKSVLLKHLIGLLQPDAGVVRIDGEDITRMDERELIRVRQRFGMVFQGAALFDSLTVAENVGFAFRRNKNMPPELVRRKVAEALEMVDLPGIENKKPAELSGGMRKRVGLARAIVYQPEIVLYDEPTTGLDPIVADHGGGDARHAHRAPGGAADSDAARSADLCGRHGRRDFQFDRSGGTPVYQRRVGSQRRLFLIMNGKGLETRVGVFVFAGLVLLAVLLVLFSKGMTLTRDVFYVQLRSTRVGGIQPGANVLLAGVPVGRVADVTLDPDGKGVTMRLKISARYRLYGDARFQVEQAGFLGDQYIAIYPGDNVGEPLTNNAVVHCQPPFNVQEAIAQAVETISRIGQATTNVNAAVADVRRHLLNQQRLTQMGEAVDRFALLTAEAQSTVSNLNTLVAANALPITRAVSNLSHFSTQLGRLGTNVNEWFDANDERLTALLQNLESASVALTNLLHGLQAGRGAAGRLLQDEQLAAQLSAIAQNLAITTSNLNRRGLWGILWASRPARTNPPPAAERLRAPHDPFR